MSYVNRIRDHLPCQCGSRTKAPAPSLGDKLLAGSHRLKIEVWRCAGGEVELEFQLHGSFSSGGDDDDADTIGQCDPADLRRLATALLGEFTAKREGGAQ